MVEKIIIAGGGGQGIMLLGRVLAEAAMRQAKFVTWIPAYGAEVRGGSAYCMVVISDKEVSSPYIDQADALILMNAPALSRFKQRLRQGGLCIINSSLIRKNLRNHCISYPFTDIALGLGNTKVANMVALGCYLAQRKIFALPWAKKTLCAIAGKDSQGLLKMNEQALGEGYKLDGQG